MAGRQIDHQFHAERAKAELEQARRATSRPAIEAHLMLSRLHIERLRSLGDEAPAL